MSKVVKVSVFVKHDDRALISLLDANNNTVEEQTDDYLPYVGVFGGEETELEIDNETGKIIGWVPIHSLT